MFTSNRVNISKVQKPWSGPCRSSRNSTQSAGKAGTTGSEASQANPAPASPPRTRSKLLASSDGASTPKTCGACGLELPPSHGGEVKCTCGWKPSKAGQHILTLVSLVALAGVIGGAGWFFSNYYNYFPDKAGADRLIARAKDMRRRPDNSASIEFYRQASKLDPKRVDVHRQLALLLAEDEYPNAALTEARIAIEMDPRDYGTHQAYLGLLERCGTDEDTVKGFEAALARFPKNNTIHMQAATYYQTQNMLDKSEKLYKEATQLEKVGDLSWISLASVQEQSGKTNDAIATLKEGMGPNPSSAALYFTLGSLYAKHKNPESVKTLQKASAMDPNYTEQVAALLEQSDTAGPGEVHICHLQKYGDSYLVDVTINGQYRLKLQLDTGANFCVLPTRLAKWAGLDLSKFPTHPFASATGITKAPAVTLRSVKVGQAEAHDVVGVFHDMPDGGPADGLLGITFLEKFNVTMDTQSLQLLLQDRTAKPRKAKK